MSEWISVANELPREDEVVIICYEEGLTSAIAARWKENAFRPEEPDCHGYDKYDMPSYWMRLCEPPESRPSMDEPICPICGRVVKPTSDAAIQLITLGYAKCPHCSACVLCEMRLVAKDRKASNRGELR